MEHSQKYCMRDPKYVKCDNEYWTKDYNKSKKTKVKCVNFQENHTTYYRGCPVYKNKIIAIVDPKTITAKQRLLNKNPEVALMPARKNLKPVSHIPTLKLLRNL